MKSKPIGILICFFAAVLFLLWHGVGKGNQETNSYVGEETCKGCHDDVAAGFEKTPHRKLIELGGLSDSQKGCEACHGPGGDHVNGGGDVSKIIRFQKPEELSASEALAANEICLKCHQKANLSAWMASSHSANGIACISCHDPHRAESPKLIRARSKPHPDKWEDKKWGSNFPRGDDEVTELCFSCHREKRAQLSMFSHHPVLEGRMNCASCHDPHGINENNLKEITTRETCVKCHRDKAGPFAYEHPPVAEDCLICHKPHGSTNPSLLTLEQPVLCARCHRVVHVDWARSVKGPGVPNMNERIAGSLAYMRCGGCHMVHGSDHNNQFTY
ncbi:MAG: DmsE family decaheme c-type cytochrome [Firmicutes bacterium]|nr:DmsE family decaheme c-type cytochrome [Bacillota bacterium]